MMKTMIVGAALVVGFLTALSGSGEARGPRRGCWEGGQVASRPAAPSTGRSGNAELGREVYLARCTACHAADTSRDGRVGPAIKGSSPELVRTRVLWAAYPPGYAPKRPTRFMPPQPDLAARINDLAAYLAR
jgi:mono/diheme cytochrome c family protein